MKFLVDAQLPKRLVALMRHAGHDVVHTSDLPEHNRTSDQRIVEIADQEDRVVVTKDADFVDSFILQGRPQRLLVIATGNISNADLETLFVTSPTAYRGGVRTPSVSGTLSYRIGDSSVKNRIPETVLH